MDINNLTSVNRKQLEGIILAASRKTGADFAYMLDKAQTESGLRVDAKARTSSATGLYQFIDQTWLNMLKAYGAKHGYADVANVIERDATGQAAVADAAQRRAILDLRKDPKISALMAGEFAKENQRALEERTGTEAGRTELYLAHFLGAGGASKLINARQADDSASAAALLPRAAKANRSIFYHQDGSARSVGEVYNHFAAKFEPEKAVAALSPQLAAQSAPEHAAPPVSFPKAAAAYAPSVFSPLNYTPVSAPSLAYDSLRGTPFDLASLLDFQSRMTPLLEQRDNPAA